MKKLLVIVDMQNDFVDGSLGTPEAEKILPKVVNKAATALESDCDIIFTRDTHGDNYLETSEGKNLPILHCAENTHGWQIHDDLRKFSETAKIFNKITFGSKELALELFRLNESEKIDEIELCGLCTDICVISNALLIKAFLPEVKITVDSSCCAGVTPQSHLNALDAMRVCQINII